jgi:hypothetical protein
MVSRLRREPVFVDQPAEQVAATEALEIDHLTDPALVDGSGLVSGGRCSSERCGRCSL